MKSPPVVPLLSIMNPKNLTLSMLSGEQGLDVVVDTEVDVEVDTLVVTVVLTRVSMLVLTVVVVVLLLWVSVLTETWYDVKREKVVPGILVTFLTVEVRVIVGAVPPMMVVEVSVIGLVRVIVVVAAFGSSLVLVR